MVERIPHALLVGIVTGLIAVVLIAIVSALIPKVSLDASYWGLLVGVVAGLYVLFTGKRAV